MITRARAWLDQWQLNPSAVPVLLLMLAACGLTAIQAAVELRAVPTSYFLAALGVACLVISLWWSQRLSADDRNGVKYAVLIMATSGATRSLEPMLSSDPVHWVYRLSLCVVVFLLLKPAVDLLEAGVRRLG